MLKAKLNQLNMKLNTHTIKTIVPIAGALGIGCISTALFQYIFKSVDPGLVIGASAIAVWRAGKEHLKNARAELRVNTSHEKPENDACTRKKTSNRPASFFYEVE